MALRTGNSSNYEEMLQIYGNDDRTGGSTSLWIDSNEWYIGVQVFDEAGDQLGHAFFSLGYGRGNSEYQGIWDAPNFLSHEL